MTNSGEDRSDSIGGIIKDVEPEYMQFLSSKRGGVQLYSQSDRADDRDHKLEDNGLGIVYAYSESKKAQLFPASEQISGITLKFMESSRITILVSWTVI